MQLILLLVKNLKEGLYLFSNRFNQKLSQVAKKFKTFI